jgi:DNA-binding SARP family transcriptional activator
MSAKEEIRNEAARVLEAATYSSETQFEYSKRWRRVDRWIGSVAAALAAVAGVGGLSQVFSARWAGLIAVLAAGTGAVAASIGAPQTKEKASGSATAYRALQQDARMFLTIDLGILPEDEARARLQELVERLQQLNRVAEVPSAGAWKRAKRSIEQGSQRYEVDER